MARTYRFDYFTVQKQDPSRALLRRDKQKFTELKPQVGGEKFHYGKQHAQTEELYQAREMAAQLEALAGLDSEVSSAAPTSPSKTEQASEARFLGKPAPIGALPETPDAPEPNAWGELWDSSRRNVRALFEAIKDAQSAAVRIAVTPLDGAKLAARQLSQKVRSLPAWS